MLKTMSVEKVSKLIVRGAFEESVFSSIFAKPTDEWSAFRKAISEFNYLEIGAYDNEYDVFMDVATEQYHKDTLSEIIASKYLAGEYDISRILFFYYFYDRISP